MKLARRPGNGLRVVSFRCPTNPAPRAPVPGGGTHASTHPNRRPRGHHRPRHGPTGHARAGRRQLAGGSRPAHRDRVLELPDHPAGLRRPHGDQRRPPTRARPGHRLHGVARRPHLHLHAARGRQVPQRSCLHGRRRRVLVRAHRRRGDGLAAGQPLRPGRLGRSDRRPHRTVHAAAGVRAVPGQPPAVDDRGARGRGGARQPAAGGDRHRSVHAQRDRARHLHAVDGQPRLLPRGRARRGGPEVQRRARGLHARGRPAHRRLPPGARRGPGDRPDARHRQRHHAARHPGLGLHPARRQRPPARPSTIRWCGAP
jgi:hypothetical protein